MIKKNGFNIVISGLLLILLAVIIYAVSTFAQAQGSIPPATEAVEDGLFSLQHFVMVTTILIPFLIFWMDSRRQTNKHHIEIMEQQQQLHVQNMERFKELETKIEPLWKWWNHQQGTKGRDR